jgi:hypothetical protein
MTQENQAAVLAYSLLADPICAEAPGLAAAVALGDQPVLERIQRMAVIYRIVRQISPTERTRRAEERFGQIWKNWR